MYRIDRLGSVAGAWALVATVLAQGCAPFHLDIASCPVERTPVAPPDKITVQYLGVGGFLLYRGRPEDGQVVLTAPLYSNPSLLEVVGDYTLRPDTELIDRLLPVEAGEARAILVGHSHYDHLMDVPYVALAKARHANVYGSETVAHLLAPIAPRLAQQGTAVVPFHDAEVWDQARAGLWKSVAPGVRVAAIRSEHSPQAALKVGRERMPFHLWRGPRTEDAAELPRGASDWAEGGVLAYLIDFVDAGDAVRFRVYYQDSGANEPLGLVPDSLKQGREADLAILCVGGDYGRLNDHPGAILRNTRPRYVLLSHWEDFFVTQDAYCAKGGHYGPGPSSGCKDDIGAVYGLPSAFFVEGNQVKPFVKQVEKTLRSEHLDARYWLPCPTRSVFDFPVR